MHHFRSALEKMYEGSKLQSQCAFQILKSHFKNYNLHIKLVVALECLISVDSRLTPREKTPATKLFDPELKATDRSIEIVLRGGPPLVDEF